jgi:hypothetical protein
MSASVRVKAPLLQWPNVHGVSTPLPEIKIMLASRFLTTTAIGALLATAAVLPAPVLAGEYRLPQATEARKALSMPQIYDKLTALGYWNIDKIERDPRSYEVSANDKSGDRVKLYVDAQTGEVVERRLDNRRRLMAERRQPSVDCNERRCRDDLPARGDAAAAGGK